MVIVDTRPGPPGFYDGGGAGYGRNPLFKWPFGRIPYTISKQYNKIE
jgi:hypothetical protein